MLPLTAVDSQFNHLDIVIKSYSGSHTYLSAGNFYVLSTSDPNRIANIININLGNSANTQFYIEDTIFTNVPNNLGFNESPVFLNPPIEIANLNEVYVHSLCAHDAEGDSLGFRLVHPLQAGGVSVPNYQYPDQITSCTSNQISLDQTTGELTWNSPKEVGVYNVAIAISEYRCGVQLSTVMRDMQIIVYDEPNTSPTFLPVNDITVFSGTPVQFQVFAADVNTTQLLSITSNGGPLNFANNPAQFLATNSLGSALGAFSWTPQLSQSSLQPYIITFKANDDYSSTGGLNIPLTSFSTVKLQVLPHPDSSWTDPCSSFQPTTTESKRPSQVQVYPNPSKGLFVFRQLPTNSSIEIFSCSGKTVVTKTTFDHEIQLNLANHPTGLYFYSIKTTDMQIHSGKLMLE